MDRQLFKTKRFFNVMIFIVLGYTLFLTSCQHDSIALISPNGKNKISFNITKEGAIYYRVYHNNVGFIEASKLGFKFKCMDLKDNFVINSIDSLHENHQWKTVWGQQEIIQNKYNMLKVELIHKQSNIKLDMIFRAYNDGVAFKYVIPTQANIKDFIITDGNYSGSIIV
ncbi:glycoside hydrolase family 97 N-terminal domain-containing protein [Halosquirtibacter xylanolyticus]|uniref:glycoside hydrolase family 97 N-terminal domain-containing protein n=1 Tax=Halosquirtibacter xylanolyticus TaxID=3374599 RepID=UPI0037490F1F|nr:glycoside hydrolase family 97 N-terminal domain-containing protein [Prolixibacteraceae bacterium]